jgi:hypothetical protein
MIMASALAGEAVMSGEAVNPTEEQPPAARDG